MQVLKWKLFLWWYCCENCGHLFHTGKFYKEDSDMHDDVCPYCGALACTVWSYLGYLWYKFCELFKRKEV